MAARLTLRLAGQRSPWLQPQPISTVLDHRRGAGGNLAASVGVLEIPGKLKTQEDLPVIKTWKVLYRVLFKGYLNRLHELQV